MFLKQVYDTGLAQAAYMVGCQETGEAVVVDPERDIDQYHRIARDNDLRITAVAETHIHADFVSGAREFAQDPDITLYLSGLGGEEWSYTWVGERPNTVFLRDGDTFRVGNVEFAAVHTPGHTPEHLSYLVTDLGGGADMPIAMMTGDFVFVGDVGRPDLLESAAGVAGAMEPSARQLAHSLREKLPHLPEFLQILPGHGAGSACGKALGAIPSSTLGYERRFNAALSVANAGAERFVQEILSGQPEPPLYFSRMKVVNRDGIAVTGGPPEVPHLDPARFVEEGRKDATRILDTRAQREAFVARHVQGAVHTPLKGAELTAAAGSVVSADEQVLLVLDSHDEVDTVRRQLYRIGLDNIVGYAVFAELDGAAEVEMVELPAREFADLSRGSWSGNDDGSEQVLDVRGQDEFAGGHVPGAWNAPYTRLREHIGELPRDIRYHVHCRSGRRAAIAASFLASEGYEVVLLDGHCDACLTAA